VSHKGIRLLIQDVAKSLGDDIQFTYARTSDFNILRDKRYPFITLDPLTSAAIYAVDNVQNYSKTWACTMAFYEMDKATSTQEEYSKILDSTDVLVDSFINKLNFYSLKSDSIVITNISQNPFIKAMADILTGHILTFNVQVLDTFNYCGLDDC
jgi:hypothetical protein